MWNPNLVYIIDRLKMFTAITPKVYLQHLLKEQHRICFDLVYYYKVFNHSTP
jgi:hypothetical protein